MSALNQAGFDPARNAFFVDAGCENWTVVSHAVEWIQQDLARRQLLFGRSGRSYHRRRVWIAVAAARPDRGSPARRGHRDVGRRGRTGAIASRLRRQRDERRAGPVLGLVRRRVRQLRRHRALLLCPTARRAGSRHASRTLAWNWSDLDRNSFAGPAGRLRRARRGDARYRLQPAETEPRLERTDRPDPADGVRPRRR